MRDEFSLAQKLEPISSEELADVVDADAELVTDTLRALRDEFSRDRRGFQIAELASGWVMQSSPDVAQWVTKFANRDVSHRLSSAALETLAIIAYRQPVSRAQITALRGVNVDGVSRLLEQRGYIEEKGRAGGPGQPILYGTTELFLDRMGLATIRDLPPIEEFMPPIEIANELVDEMAYGLDDEAGVS
jgi:segregation and condensation protein B